MVLEVASAEFAQTPANQFGATGSLAAQTRASVRADSKSLYKPLMQRLPAFIGYLIVAAILVLGWQNRSAEILTAESGFGYALGIIGSSMMLLLLVYPWRKRVKGLRHLGTTKGWFRIHMALGILGPTAILFHSNFDMGSINSSVALWSMLVVAGSGLIGRYFYTKIHYGLYGRQADLRRLSEAYEDSREMLPGMVELPPEAQYQLDRLGGIAVSQQSRGLARFFMLCSIGAKTHLTMIRAKRSIASELPAMAQASGWSPMRQRQIYRVLARRVGVYLALVRQVAGFTLFERLFALWHILHLPLFVILVVSAIIHVIVVHAY